MKRQKTFLLVLIFVCFGLASFWRLTGYNRPHSETGQPLDGQLSSKSASHLIAKRQAVGSPVVDSVSGITDSQFSSQAETRFSEFEAMAADPVLDAVYPQAEWIQRALDQGYIIETFEDYLGFLAARGNLIHLENDPEAWASGRLGIAPTDDFETYREAYIDRKMWEYSQIQAAVQADPNVNGGFFKDGGAFLPFAPGRVYVERDGLAATFLGADLSPAQKFALLTKGVSPEGYEVIYLDGAGNQLAEPPPLLTREEVLNAGGAPSLAVYRDAPAETDIHTYTGTEMEPASSEHETAADGMNLYASAVERAEQMQSAQAAFLQGIEMVESDEDFWAAFEKQMAAEFTLPEDVESLFTDKQTSPEYLNRAMDTLNRYGPAEGLRKLRTENPEFAAQVERRFGKFSNMEGR